MIICSTGQLRFCIEIIQLPLVIGPSPPHCLLIISVWLYYKGDNADEAGEREAKQNIGVVDAAKRQGVPHITFSTLYDFGKAFPVPHCDSKVKG